jgi:hypothetical protein
MTQAKNITLLAKRLELWAQHYRACRDQQQAANDLLGAACDCRLLEPFWRALEGYTEAMSEMVGDRDEWLSWYAIECRLGDEPKEAKMPCGRVIKCTSLRELARVITLSRRE